MVGTSISYKTFFKALAVRPNVYDAKQIYLKLIGVSESTFVKEINNVIAYANKFMDGTVKGRFLVNVSK